jgi:tellurite resistance protein TerC
MELSLWFWVFFHILIISLLFLDLKILHPYLHAVQTKQVWITSCFWILLALLFNIAIYFWQGIEVALQFFSGYLIEKSLSLDNLFVFLLIFQAFQIPKSQQQRVLFWGVLGALVFRIGCILLGAKLINSFTWVLYIFAVILLFTAYKLFRREIVFDVHNSFILRVFEKFIPISKEKNTNFFVLKEQGRWKATPLLLALLAIESSDIVFAIDSIPAIFAITTDSFIVYTSNVFAILGLRSLYFVLYQLIEKLRYLRFGLASILFFTACKIILSPIYPIPIAFSLVIILLILFLTVIFSVFSKKN